MSRLIRPRPQAADDPSQRVSGSLSDSLPDRLDDLRLGSLVAALAGDRRDADQRLHDVEAAIRHHWTTLQSLVREHETLVAAARTRPAAPAPDRPQAPASGKLRLLVPPRHHP
ncbi:hypothetical protein [Rhodospirillum centenum]|uniref:Uncharacterized protein n=1 Tax=Rhodospirillum centenum (strain ATCC 51521 / SW) TaxID=414684 RepID=B6IXB6_RHOCS|nr:hypothetical protein [Rhodospirillum centenum]ACJ00940.1 hypothetical protein RC1_3590 [Rhodospirillum centenum SW]